VTWRDGALSSASSIVHDFSVSIQLQEESGMQWWFTGVYGPHQDNLTQFFLQELRDVRGLCAGPWYRCTFGPPGPARPKPENARIV
jgi:hypothetical protein